jgi:hypothetical protein
MEPQGRKEVCEAVLIAACTAACTALINFGVEELKKHLAKKAAIKPPEVAASDAQL